MINLKEYRQHPHKFQQWAKDKWVEIDRQRFDQLDEYIKTHTQQMEELLAQRNTLSKQIEQALKNKEDAQAHIQQVKEIKERVETLQAQINEAQQEFQHILLHIPLPALDDVPVGASDQENVVIEEVGTKPTFDFTPRPHREILEEAGLLDQERAVKLSGSRFQILRWSLARLEFALMQWAVDKLTSKWFTFTVVPQLVKDEALVTTGFLPNDAMNIYRVNPAAPTPQQEREEDDLYLIGTAEVALVSQHNNETFSPEELPRRYVGFSSCFRREAGTYGKDTKGLIRLHQFEKVEMVSFVDPQDSVKEHEMLLEIEEEIFQDLGIPYQKLLICTGDLGGPAAKKYDLEAWFPGIGKYVEVTSTSNTQDFQTRRGNIKYTTDGKNEFVHSLNGTAVALGRALAAIVENYQQADGTVAIPDVLRPYMQNASTL